MMTSFITTLRTAFSRKPLDTAFPYTGGKVYDVFTFFNELDLLEIRLHILDPYVDYFVIIEATETFSGKPKPLYYQENQERFKQWHHKIIHYVTTDTPRDEAELQYRLDTKQLSPIEKEVIENTLTTTNFPKGAIHWMKEFYQKESIKKALVHVDDEDICFIGDLDEIWNPKAQFNFKKDDIYKLRQYAYVYYLNNRSSEPWAGTILTKYKNIRNACLNHLRDRGKTRYTYVNDAGWHFTNMGGADQIRKKLESYGHQEFNTTDIKSQIEDKIKNNKDFIGRGFRFWKDETKLPEYIINNKDTYKTLLI